MVIISVSFASVASVLCVFLLYTQSVVSLKNTITVILIYQVPRRELNTWSVDMSPLHEEMYINCTRVLKTNEENFRAGHLKFKWI